MLYYNEKRYEDAIEAYKLVVKNYPALIALEMMDFEGIDKIKEQVAQGQIGRASCRERV